MSPSKKILIVGGTGFIGYHLAKKSLKKGWKVTSISTKQPKKIRYLRKVKYILCDITKKNKLKNRILESYDYVVNLGGHVDHSNKKKTFKSHYLGCKNLTKIFLKNPPRAFIQMGSCIEYGKSKSPHKEISLHTHKSLSPHYKSPHLHTPPTITNLYIPSLKYGSELTLT